MHLGLDRRAGSAYRFGVPFYIAVPFGGGQRMQAALQRRQLALGVRQHKLHEGRVVVHLPDPGGNLCEADPAGCGGAVVPADDLVAAANGTDQDGVAGIEPGLLQLLRNSRDHILPLHNARVGRMRVEQGDINESGCVVHLLVLSKPGGGSGRPPPWRYSCFSGAASVGTRPENCWHIWW